MRLAGARRGFVGELAARKGILLALRVAVPTEDLASAHVVVAIATSMRIPLGIVCSPRTFHRAGASVVRSVWKAKRTAPSLVILRSR